MSAPMVEWICSELSKLLGFEATDDIARYILEIETEGDLQDYLYDLLDPSVPKHKRFVAQLVKKWTPPTRKVEAAVPENALVYKKSGDAENFITGNQKPTKTTNKKSKKQISSTNAVLTNNGIKPEQDVRSRDVKSTSSVSSTGAIKKTKFVPLFSDEGHAKTVARLPGRYNCDCLATKHNLINNCIKCGRIVCEQEGSGPCLFCGNLVCTNEELEILARGSKKSEKLRQQLMGLDLKHSSASTSNSNNLPNVSARVHQGLEKAKQHKDKLIDYDKTSVKRTHVIDDQSDYFAVDSRWVNQKEKSLLQKREEELRAQRFASRKDRKVTLDFAGRQVLESNESVDMYGVNDSVIQSVHFDKTLDNVNKHQPVFTDADFTDLVNPAIKQQPPQYIESKWASNLPRKGVENEDSGKKTSRIQDREILEMSDDGMCMSMHQPWAQLLVKGIKMHEGRSWYTPHRGRLWIAATVKPPQPHEISEVEHQYIQHYNDSSISFPKDYPVGCLLGCVDVVDCLDQEEYLKKYPGGESGSPYVFICENPQELVVKFPMKGKHKIYKLDHHIHQGAKKGLRPS